eukprot:8556810-Heterocapsa_arctica.AAC.1
MSSAIFSKASRSQCYYCYYYYYYYYCYYDYYYHFYWDEALFYQSRVRRDLSLAKSDSSLKIIISTQ